MLSLKDCLGHIAAGVTTPDEAVSQALEEIAVRDPDIGAFVCVDQTVRAGNTGPLLGIAVGVKDIIDTADFPTQMGSAL
jgi:Asp-tRNA(Asn)/Glu-tRNA(Gln) amidotransferase A subunit family amidase